MTLTHLIFFEFFVGASAVAAPAVIVGDSLQYTLPENRFDWTLPDNRLEYTLPENRLEYTIP